MPLPFNIIFGLLIIGMSIVFTVLALPLWLRKVPMNQWYGMRIPKAFESNEKWYHINEYGGKLLFYLIALPTFATGIVAFVIPMRPESAWPMVLINIPIACIIVLIIVIYRYAKQL